MIRSLLKILPFAFIFWNGFVFCQPKICLNMIVKDESHVIKRCLDSVKGMIDYWVICDTGSKDNTIEIIKECLKDIPGDLYEKPWVNFGHNRNEALELAKDKADFILFMDADDWLIPQSDFSLPDLTKDFYFIECEHGDGCNYMKSFILSTALPWKWVGVLHEYLDCDRAYHIGTLKNIKYHYGADGARSKDPAKFLKAARTLEEALEKEPNNTRYAFYLAESYKDAGEKIKALEAYQKRISMGGWDEETFWSMMYSAFILKDLNKPIEDVIKAFDLAHHFRPHRAEPIYFLAEIYNDINQYEQAIECINAWKKQTKKNEDLLVNLTWTEEYGIDFQYGIASYWLGNYNECIDACNRVLSRENIVDAFRNQTIQNRLCALRELDKPFKEGQILDKTVLIAILAHNKEHVLPHFLKSIENQNYNKKLISIYINTNNNTDGTVEVLKTWVESNKDAYRSIIFDEHTVEMATGNPHQWNNERFSILADIRNKSLRKAKELSCDYYFVVDCDNFIAPDTLTYLIKKNKPIIAPLLRAIPNENDPYSNYFAACDPNGFFQDCPEYYEMLKGEKKGTHKVPVVHCTYLINSKYIDHLSYTDSSGKASTWEFILFSQNARVNGVDQYICNEKEFGTLIHTSEKTTLTDEKSMIKKLSLLTEELWGRYSHCIDIDQALLDQNWQAALLHYKEMALKERNKDRVYTAILKIAEMQDKLHFPMEEIENSFRRAAHYAPERAEAFSHLAKFYFNNQRYKEAYETNLEGLRIATFFPLTENGKVHNDLLWQLSLSAHHSGNFAESIDAIYKNLNRKNLHQNERDRLIKNLGYAQSGEHTSKLAKEKWGSFPSEVKKIRKNTRYRPLRGLSKLHICTNASPNSEQLLDSAHLHGHHVNVLGKDEELAFGKRLKQYREFINQIPDEDIVLCVDAHDILLLANEKKILDAFYSFNSPCVFPAERSCHPLAHLKQFYPQSSTKFKYLNAGSFIGYAKQLKELFNLLGEIPNKTDGQGLMSYFYLYFPELITLDVEAKLFLTLFDVSMDEFEIKDKKVTYHETKTTPCIVQGASKFLYQQIYSQVK